MSKRCLIISNRLPIRITKKKGKISTKHSVGGLVTGLAACHELFDCKWIGWPGISLNKIKKERTNIEEQFISEFNYYPIFLSQRNIENSYLGFCNKTLWPLFHYFVHYAIYKKEFWREYKEVNSRFCDKVLELAGQEDNIWIHDFHLMLLPCLIRERLPQATIGFFLHIPFPSFEIFRLLPWRKEILSGMLGADLIGFHTYDYVRHFLSSVYRLLGVDAKLGELRMQDRIIKADAFPIGIDYRKFFNIKDNKQVKNEIDEIRKRVGERKIILSMDRLDYTKGIPQRLICFKRFLEKYPNLRNKIIFICIAVPSRTIIEDYQKLKQETDELIGSINGKYGTIGWTPIWYLYRQIPFHQLLALYKEADVALITPFRDGMNLIAKEFVATKKDGRGVLILSEGAGAASELGEAIIINPNNIEEMADSIYRALLMSEEEQIKRNRQMQRRLQRYDIVRWTYEFFTNLESIKDSQKEFQTKYLSVDKQNLLIKEYKSSKSRLILLDYDGTLIEYFNSPSDAFPTDEILDMLKDLKLEERNCIVLITGRKKDELMKWFKDSDINFVAEHGIWIKEQGMDWKMIELLQNKWKAEIRPILEVYTDRTPGSFIEEKEFSIVWHYRKVDTELGSRRARELAAVLKNLTANYKLHILEGSKVIEIKNAGINKGRAALHWILKKEWDFILALGDDWTDEDTFESLPDFAYSIKIGSAPSQAKFRMKNPKETRFFFKKLIHGG